MSQSLPAPLRHLLHRQARLEIARVFELPERHTPSGEKRIHKGLILVFIEGTVEVVVAALAVAGGGENDGAVNAVRGHDRGNGIVEIKMVFPGEGLEGGGQSLGGERTAGDDHDPSGRDLPQFFPHHLHLRPA
jgi:hypothetical protein